MDNNLAQPPEDSLESPDNGTTLDQRAAAGGTPNEPGVFSHFRRSYATLAVIGFILLILLIYGVSKMAMKDEKRQPAAQPITINTQNLDNGTLNKLTTTGTPTETKTQLTISPDTLFKSDVHVQGSLQVDRNLEVKGTTTLQGATSINSNLAVRGSVSVGGTLSAPALNIGTLTTTSINVTGSISFGEHLVPTGSTPSVTASKAALGGSVQISGNDTAGTITISTGTGAPLAGEMANIHFRKAFGSTPKVQLTPINAESAALRYYAARSAGFFTINTGTAPTTQTSYTFDYLVTQ
jgi:hypothetical protein